MTAAVFVSYRRDDSKHAAGRLAERLNERFTLFMDVDSIVPGSDFVSAVRDAVARADVVVAVIGPGWLAAHDERGERRIDQPDDWVAAEISTALERRIPLIPVLVDGARMPSRAELPPALTGLADRQAITMTHESFSSDCARLEQVLGNLVHAEELPAQGPGVPRGLPPVPTGRRSSVPRPTDPLLGRDRELAELEEILGDPAVALVTMVGPGGMGKTRLAVELSQRLSQRREVEFVALDVVPSADLVLSTIAAHLQVKASPELDLVLQLAAALSGRDFLLVLDNFEHVMDAAADVARLIHGAEGLQVLVTSRESLHIGGEHVFTLGPLETGPTSDGAAVDLFCQRAQAAGAHLDLEVSLPAIREISVRLDGMPLAIELAAARTNVLSPDAILHRLERRLGLLTGGTRDAHPRQRSLRACLEWSVDLLAPDDRRLFATMAVFAGGAIMETLEAVCGEVIPDVDLLTSLGSLVAKSLVDVVPHSAGQRFVMLETVREYAAELLAEEDEPDVRSAHARHFRDLLSSDGRGSTSPPRNIEELNKWTAELPNARAAIASTIQAGDVEAAADLVLAVGNLWRLRGEWPEVEKHTTWLLQQTGIPTERRLDLYFFKAVSLVFRAYARAQEAIDQGLRLAAGSDQRYDAQEADLWQASSLIAFQAGDLARSRDEWTRAIEAAQRAGDPELVASVTAFRLDPVRSEDLPVWDQALQTARNTGNLVLEGVLLSNLSEGAVDSVDQGVLERGVEAGLDAYKVSGVLGNVDGQAAGLCNAGAALLMLGSPQAAAEHLRAALVLGRGVSFWGLQVELLVRVAAAESALGHAALARELFASWYALGEGWPHGVPPSNQRLIDTFLPEIWAARESMPVTDVSLSDAVDLALRDHAPT